HHAHPSFISPPRPPLVPTLSPYTTLFRSQNQHMVILFYSMKSRACSPLYSSMPSIVMTRSVSVSPFCMSMRIVFSGSAPSMFSRSEEHTSELQSRFDLVCRLLLEKKKKIA